MIDLAAYTPLDKAFALLDAVLGALIAYCSICIANDMGKRGLLIKRLAYTILSGGGVALVLAPLFGASPPQWPQVIAHAGVALLMLDGERGER